MKHHRRIILAVTFSHSQHFVNPARVPPSYLSKNSNRIVIANAGSYPPNALLLMTGAVSECNLREPYETIRGLKTIRSRRIGIFPFLLEYERTMACIGLTLGLNQVMAGVVAGSVYFSTRSECMFFCCLSLPVSDIICRQASDGYGRTSQVLTPKKMNWFAKKPPSNITPAKRGVYPASLGFNDDGMYLSSLGLHFLLLISTC